MTNILLENSVMLSEKIANVQVDRISIFPKGHVTLIAGEPGIGKTWLMLSIAKSLAEGTRGIGSPIDKYPVGKSLIFAGETGVRLLANRIKLMGGLTPLENCRVISSHLCANLNIDTMINTAIGRKNIEGAVEEYKPDMVFFDTMISFMADGKDESSQVDMSDCLRGLGAIASRYNVAMVLLHHFRKRKSSGEVAERSMDEVIGSSAFIRLASLVIGIERKREVRTVRCFKSWWEEFTPFAFTISKTKEGVVYLSQDYNYNSDGSSSPSRFSRLLAEKITMSYVNRSFTIMDVVADFDVSRSSASEAVQRLCSKGEAYCYGKDGYSKVYRLGVSEDPSLFGEREVSVDDN